MHPVQPVPLRQLDVIVDHHRHVSGMGDLSRQIGKAAQLVLLGPGADAQAGRGHAVHHLGQHRRQGWMPAAPAGVIRYS